MYTTAIAAIAIDFAPLRTFLKQKVLDAVKGQVRECIPGDGDEAEMDLFRGAVSEYYSIF